MTKVEKKDSEETNSVLTEISVEKLKEEYKKTLRFYFDFIAKINTHKKETERFTTLAINLEGQLGALKKMGDLNHNELLEEVKKEQENKA